MKQTAVEWLAEQITTVKWKMSDVTDRNSIIEQAKEMEKQQIIEAHGNQTKKSGGITNHTYILTGEQYYNETFKNK
jgi:serine/threonine protein phosphatase PrpC